MPSVSAEFFDLILPENEGWRCLFVLPARKHFWYRTNAEMAAALPALNAKYQAVYHGCATYRTRKNRLQENTLGAATLWLDLDCGPGKPYPDLATCYRAFEEWRRANRVPQPVIVGSGSGLHLYWRLPQYYGMDDGWRRLSAGLAALSGPLRPGPERTQDIASILRPPGSTHRKDPANPREVVLAATGEIVSEDFLARLENAAGIGGVVSPASQLANLGEGFRRSAAALAKVGAQSLEDALSNVRSVEAPSDPERIAQHCAQVDALRVSKGRLPEPQWYAILGVLAHCGEVGRSAAHAWSSGDERYDAADCEAKLDHAFTAAGSTKCVRLDQVNPGVCITCPHMGKISSPIQLGRHLNPSVLTEKPVDAILPGLPKPFRFMHSRLMMDTEVEDENGITKIVPIIVADYPIYVFDVLKAERSDATSVVFRSWEPMQASWVEFPVLLKEVYSERGAGAMAHHGVTIAKKRWPHFQHFIDRSVVEFRAVRHYGTRYSQFGWKTLPDGTRGFLLGTTLMTVAGETRAFGDAELERRARLMTPIGRPEKWKQAVETLFAGPDMEAHAYMTLMGFGSIVYHMHEQAGSGVGHGASKQTGNGKTTAGHGAISAFGRLEAFSVSTRDTQVAKFLVLGLLNHLPAIFDENRSDDPEVVKSWILQCTLGQDKNRGAAEGGLRGDTMTWCNIVISAANISLRDTTMYDGTEIAQAARVFEFQVRLPPGHTVAEGAAMARQMWQNSGHAGRAFIKKCLVHYDEVHAMLHRMVGHIERLLGNGPSLRFVIRNIAATLTAGHYCREWGIVDLPIERIATWAVTQARAGDEQITTALASDDPATVLGTMLGDLQPYIVVVTGKEDTSATSVPLKFSARELYGRYEQTTRKLYLDTRAIRRWMVKQNQPFTETRDALATAGVLLSFMGKKVLTTGTGLVSGQVRVWEINASHEWVAGAIETFQENVTPLRREK